jgi:hypothetical protein
MIVSARPKIRNVQAGAGVVEMTGLAELSEAVGS